jgi:multicomponent Na+:H+ antiporter subunit B
MDDHDTSGMSLIVKTITRLTMGLILLYGIYIVLHGHLAPGGGFAGGTIIALSFVHLMLAFGRKAALGKLTQPIALAFQSVGALIFLCIGLLGLVGGFFLENFIPLGTPFELVSAGIIPFCNIGICFNVGAGLFVVFLMLILVRPESGEE